jgi:DNA modification methylase
MKEFYNQVILGDSLEILKNIPDNYVDLVITSPPYFQQRDYGNDGKGIGNEKTEIEYLNKLLAIFKESVRVTKTTGTIVYNVGDKYYKGGLLLIPYKFAIRAIESENIFLINDLTWVKLNPTPRQDQRKLISATEPFFIFAKSKNYHFDLDNFLTHLDEINKNDFSKPSSKLGQKYYQLIENSDLTEIEKIKAKNELEIAINDVISGKIVSFRMKIRSIHKLAYGGQAGGRNNQILQKGFTIIRINGKKLKKDMIESPVEMTKGNIHPAVYPRYIIQELIKLLTKENDLVLDPFCGSGTTCLVAKSLNRKYLGIEINSLYFELCNQRLTLENQQLELFV